jgi:hypothetical protein
LQRQIPKAFLVAVFLVLATNVGVAADQSVVRFTDVSREAGMVGPLAGIMGHGGAWGDFDGDGFLDFYVGGFCDRPNSEYKPADAPVRNRLFRNLGDGRFKPAEQSSVETYARTSGAIFADLDNSGAMALYVANNARAQTKNTNEPQRSAVLQRSQLFRNEKGKLADISAASGACPDTFLSARNVGAFDYDNDGLLDLFVVEDRFTRNPRSLLLRNMGGMKFHVANKEAGLPDDIFGLGLAVADLNGDGRPDFFVGHSLRLFLSQPNNTYREATELAAVFYQKPLDSEDWPCGVAFGDLNRDGLLDLVISAHAKTARNRVFLNRGMKDGIPRFSDVTADVGLADPVPAKCAHVEIQDFDNDGWPDIYVSAAWLEDDVVTPLIYRNAGVNGGLPHFVPPRQVKSPMVYFPAGPSADYNGDGRLDLLLVNWFPGNRCRLMRNDSPARNWLDVRVVGRSMNRMGLGAKVRLYRSGKSGVADALLGCQEISIGYGYASGQPVTCHFGLGDEPAADVQVTLPSGKVLLRPATKANQQLSIEEQ